MNPPCAANELSYQKYCQFGGVRNPKLVKVYHRWDKPCRYITYHYIGYGVMIAVP